MLELYPRLTLSDIEGTTPSCSREENSIVYRFNTYMTRETQDFWDCHTRLTSLSILRRVSYVNSTAMYTLHQYFV